jgi:hypothetical protein
MNRREFFASGGSFMAPQIPALPMSGSELKTVLDDLRNAILIRHDSIAGMVADASLDLGDHVMVPSGRYTVVPAASMMANGTTVVDLLNVPAQAVLDPEQSLSDATAVHLDTRSTAVMTEGTVFSTRAGQQFRVAATDATDAHMSNAGGVGLYLVDQDGELEPFGAGSEENPAARALHAPALVTSMVERRRYGVTLRDLVGRNYNPLHDAAVPLTGFLKELSPASIVVRDPDNLLVTLETVLQLPAATRLDLGMNTRLQRAFAGSQAHSIATDQSKDVGLYITTTSSAGAPIAWEDEAALLDDGDEAVLLSWSPEYGLNGLRGRVSRSGTSYSIDVAHPEDMSVGTVGRVARIAMYNDISIRGGVLTCAGPEQDGPHMRIYGDRLSIQGLRADDIHGGFLKVLGDDIQLDSLRCVVNEEKGQGAFGVRWLGGRRFKCSNSDVFCGDDTFQFVPSTHSTDPVFDYPCEDGLFNNCSGRSYSARLMVAGQGGTQGTQMHGHIKNCGWTGVRGYSGNRGLNIKANRSKAPMDGIFVRDCVIDGTYDHQTNDDLINIVADNTNGGNASPALDIGGFGGVLLDNVVVKNNPLGRGLDIHDNSGSTTARFVIRDCDIEGRNYPIWIESVDTVILEGGRGVAPAGTAYSIAIIGNNAHPVRHVEIRGWLAEGLGSNSDAVRFASTGDVAHVDGLTVLSLPGATATGAINVAPGAVATVGKLYTDTTALTTGSGNIVWEADTNQVGAVMQQFSGNQTVNLNHRNRTHWWVGGNPVLTVPDDATSGLPLGFEAVYFNRGTGVLSVTPAGSATVDGVTSSGKGTGFRLKKIAANSWLALLV